MCARQRRLPIETDSQTKKSHIRIQNVAAQNAEGCNFVSQKKMEALTQELTQACATDSGYCLCMENGGREKDFEGRVTYNRRRGETSMAGIKAHTRVQTVSQRRPELISPQLQQEQPAENRTSFTIRWLVAGLPFFTSIEMHTRITFQSTLIRVRATHF